ncbi:MAG: ribosomal protein S18-alanine N-acetyltransferase [Nitrospirae bacterium]|nr:ribosomal protein S18-alanine N-acetyltransferase [Nitrospirota bacterium]
MEEIIIRDTSYDDLPQIHAVENQCFTAPWSLGSFKYELGNRQSIFKVAVINKKIIGYVCLRVILDTAHVLNLAVMPEFRQKDIGSTLLQDALQELRLLYPDVEIATLEVRESNTPAITLYRKFGFSTIYKRAKYYQMPDEDAVIMGMELR